eukprot:1830252-Rhodomonas_salina.1
MACYAGMRTCYASNRSRALLLYCMRWGVCLTGVQGNMCVCMRAYEHVSSCRTRAASVSQLSDPPLNLNPTQWSAP